ncbi:MAG: PotD/PotF family extracellular solute-binding protein [Alphaproteobacteria bacterium]
MRSLLSAVFVLLLCAAVGLGYYVLNRGKLYVYTWDTYASPEVFAKFEKETGIKVVAEVYTSNDVLMAKLKEGAKYDIVAPSGNYITQLSKDGLLQPLPAGVRGLASTLSASVQKPAYDPDYTYSLPLFYGTTGIAVNTAKTAEDVTSWQQLFNRPQGEQPDIGMLDEASTVAAIASIALGQKNCDASNASIQPIKVLLANQRAFVKNYSAEGYYERLAAGDVKMQLAWSSDAFIAREKNKHIKYVYPKEGVELWLDTIAIPTNAQSVSKAEKFIAFLMKPENLAENAKFAGATPAVEAAKKFLPAEMRTAPEFNIPPGTRAVVSYSCPEDAIAAYNEMVESLTK